MRADARAIGAAKASTGQPTILLAEDDVAQRLLYTRILVGAGYEVLSTGNGDDAVQLARREMPDIVLMDVTMPGTNGWSAARMLKDDERTRRIPVILMTGHSGEAADAAAAASGCDCLLGKPTRVRDLLATVAGYVPHRSGS